MALVSVIIPVYNRRSRLHRAICSVLNQSYGEFELIVVDDGSTVDLSDLRQYVLATGNQWISLKHRSGVATARNYGVEFANGSWISFLDSDDEWHPEKLTRQIAWHHAHPDCTISQVVEQWFRNEKPFKKPGHLQQLAGDIFAESIERCVIGPSCVTMARDLWNQYGGFNPELTVCEDYELWLRITAKYSVGLVDQVLVNKFGGYKDQLSTTTVAMDCYRLVALAELMQSSDLTSQQIVLVTEGIKKRAKILAKGTEKREHKEWSQFFNQIHVPVSSDTIAELKQFWSFSCEND